MSLQVQLDIEQGPQAGRKYAVSADGVRIGRIAKNDIVLDDPLVSRFHCRILFKEDGSLWIGDLGSSNQTLLNGKIVQESQLQTGDRLTIGDTVMRVVFEAMPAAAAPAPGAPAVDLGLAPEPPKTPFQLSRSSLLILLVFAVVLLGGTVLLTMRPGKKAPPPPPPPAPKAFELEYEKVQASTGSIFRYALTITDDKKIRIEIDDTGKTHLKEEGAVKPELLQDLATHIQEAEFFSLSDDYSGLADPTVLESSEISVIIGRRVHRVRVANRVEPAAFKKVREKLEEFGKIELGIWAIQYAPEKLLAMAHDAFLLAQKMYEEREVSYGNLAKAIRSYKDAQFCLSSVEPKPDYYPDILTGLSTCLEEQTRRYDNQNFAATRAMNIKAWEDAARELRILLEMIPEPSDPRNQEARNKLLEVENRLKKIRK